MGLIGDSYPAVLPIIFKADLLGAPSLAGSLPPFFSLSPGRVLRGWPQTANLGVGGHKRLTELLELSELRHFLLGFGDVRRPGQGLRVGFAIELIGKPEMGAVPWLTGLMAVTV